MEVVRALVRTQGWVPRSAYGCSTADAAYNVIFSKKRTLEILPEDEADVEAAVNWALTDLANREHLSDFDHNLVVAAGCTVVPKRGDGILAYLPVAYARAMEREVELKARREAAKDSEHVGEVGTRLVGITLTVAGCHAIESDWGTTYIVLFHDEHGNRFKWFGSYELRPKAVVTGNWGVKEHVVWQGIKETVITRPTKTQVDASKAEPRQWYEK
jgi:hypothetical protein